LAWEISVVGDGNAALPSRSRKRLDFVFRTRNFFGVPSIATNFSPIVGDSSFCSRV
jgi:hypothetical protein